MTVDRAFVSNSTNDDALQQIHMAMRCSGAFSSYGENFAASLVAAVLEELLDALVTTPDHSKVRRVQLAWIIQPVLAFVPFTGSAFDHLDGNARLSWLPPHLLTVAIPECL